jgi:hypothetical protein
VRRGRASGSLLAVLLASCGAAAPPPDRALVELERLAFVPRAACYLPGGGDFGLPRSIVMDLFEVTRRDVAELSREHPEASWAAERFAWDEEIPGGSEPDDWPAFFTFEEAGRIASWRGMRLPTAREWIHVAVGRRALKYPWGFDQESVANTLELGLGRPCAVGTFENGRCLPFGCFDLVGNVWEWVNGYVPGVVDPHSRIQGERQIRGLHGQDDPDGRSTADAERRELQVSVMGGAFDSIRRPTFVYNDKDVLPFRFHSRLTDPRSLSPTIGARMCADAEPYLWTAASRWGDGPETRERVRAVALRWSKDPQARAELGELLDRLLAREDAPQSLRWLLEGLESPP